MAGNSSTLSIRVLVDAAQGARELRQMGDEAQGFGDKLGKIAAAGAAFAGVTAFIKGAAEAASKLQQSTGGVEAVFKGSADQVKAWGKQAATSIGLAQSEYQDLATLIGAQLKNAGTAMEDLAPKTNQLIEQGADLAAMYGGTTAEAVAALSSALKGEMDPIEKYGIALNDAAIQAEIAAQGLDTSTAAAKAAAKQQAVLALVTKQGADAWGAAAREQDSYASVMQSLSAVWENTLAQIGTALLPALAGLAKAFTGLAPTVGTVLTPIAELVGWVLQLPGPILGVAAAMGAWGVFGGAILSGLGRFNTALGKTTGSMAGFKSGLASVARFAAGGLAIAAVGFAISEIAGAFAEADRAAEAFDSTVTQLGAELYKLQASGEGTAAAIDELKTQAVEGSEGFKNLVAAGVSYGDAMDVVKNGSSASEASMKAVGAAMEGMSAETFMATAQYLNMGEAAQRVADGKAEYVAAEKAKADATGTSNAATKEAAEVAQAQAEEQAKANEEVRKAALEAAQNAAAQTAVKVALDGVKDAASQASTAIEFFVVQMQLASGMNVSMDQAAKLLNDTMRSTAEAFKAAAEEGGINTDALMSWNVAALTSTSQGSSLYDSLMQTQSAYATSTVTAYQNAAANGDTAAGMAAAAAAADTAYNAFITMATGAGLSAEQAAALAVKLGIVQGTQIDPKTFELIAKNEAADKAVADLQAAQIDPKSVEVTASVQPAEGAFTALVQQELDNTVNVDANAKSAQGTVNDFVNAKRTTTPVEVPANIQPGAQTVQSFTQQQRSTTPVTVQANTSPAQESITSLVNQQRTLTITVTANTGPAQSAINSLVNGSYTATVNVTANTSAARSAIASVPTTVSVAPASAPMAAMAADAPMMMRAFAAPATLAMPAGVAPYPALHGGRSVSESTTVPVVYNITVTGALDADATARQIESLLRRRQRRTGQAVMGRA